MIAQEEQAKNQGAKTSFASTWRGLKVCVGAILVIAPRRRQIQDLPLHKDEHYGRTILMIAPKGCVFP
jgi:hypothetical protein